MTKTILMPYKKLGGVSITEDIIKGGIEKFAKSVYAFSDYNVIPLEFTEADQRSRKITDMVVEAVHNHKPDLVWVNYDNKPLTINLQKRINVPIAWVIHNLGTSIAKINIVKIIPEFLKNGGSIFMVSEYSHKTWDKLSRRINGPDVEIPCHGYIHSSCSSGNEFLVEDKDYDLISVGRCDKGKQPFAANHKLARLEQNNIKSLVITTKYRINKNKDYYEQNKHWNNGLFETKWDLSHEEVLSHIARSKVFVSTCFGESWGITAFEALSHGVPVILLSIQGEHASECIAARSDHIIKVTNGCKPKVFLDAYNKLAAYDEDKRREIFEETNAKHSKEEWLKSVDHIVETTISNYNGNPEINTLF